MVISTSQYCMIRRTKSQFLEEMTLRLNGMEAHDRSAVNKYLDRVDLQKIEILSISPRPNYHTDYCRDSKEETFRLFPLNVI